MEIYFGGQIQAECRGNLAVIITKCHPNDTLQRYESFIYSTTSDEFINLTGVRSVSHPLARVYLGISREAGENIVKAVGDKPVDKVDFKSIDCLVIGSHFLMKASEPERIIIERTFSNEYRIIKK
ncbi:hypothetical protein J4437_05970 [Candidatus Woesearchaeota archaeon]|nr:hypothetical protein [Candidatus Woesearchaeota archaeon]